MNRDENSHLLGFGKVRYICDRNHQSFALFVMHDYINFVILSVPPDADLNERMAVVMRDLDLLQHHIAAFNPIEDTWEEMSAYLAVIVADTPQV